MVSYFDVSIKWILPCAQGEKDAGAVPSDIGNTGNVVLDRTFSEEGMNEKFYSLLRASYLERPEELSVEPVDSGYPVTIYLFSAFVHRKRTILGFFFHSHDGLPECEA